LIFLKIIEIFKYGDMDVEEMNILEEFELFLDALERNLRGWRSIQIMIKKIDPETTLTDLANFRNKFEEIKKYSAQINTNLNPPIN
jgi:hypothetical protein